MPNDLQSARIDSTARPNLASNLRTFGITTNGLTQRSLPVQLQFEVFRSTYFYVPWLMWYGFLRFSNIYVHSTCYVFVVRTKDCARFFWTKMRMPCGSKFVRTLWGFQNPFPAWVSLRLRAYVSTSFAMWVAPGRIMTFVLIFIPLYRPQHVQIQHERFSGSSS